ncbi:serine hydroxymethyltransferase family protein [Cryptosporidium andersoni]|uniref:Serine hydroxymethyltransferase n=1 Tax=Cryptosporidium andersoni TaxID=117008 RepID=A0A1J4MVT7_9CRYT|nr:serine hydroxymethyltransferase family protein [Cryptosporidium andersoni]
MSINSLPNLNISLKELDPEISSLLSQEYERQSRSLELIASENFVSQAIMDCLGSIFSVSYNDFNNSGKIISPSIQKLEILTKQRALKAFNLDSEIWGVNIQPHSGSPANFALLCSILKPHDRLMGLSLQSGGHLTHGHYTGTRKVNCSSFYFESLPYISDENGWINYDLLEKNALLYRPKLIIGGSSGYPRQINFARIREICDKVKAYFMVDIAHYSGLIAGGVYDSPEKYADFITTTTHKTLRGPRSAMIFYNKIKNPNIEVIINKTVNPGLQCSTHYNQIAALCCQLKEVLSDNWKIYSSNVLSNSKELAKYLKNQGLDILTDGTDSHIVLINSRKFNLSGLKTEKILDACGISCSRSSLPCDGGTMNCSGIRLGSGALTTRGLNKKDFEVIANLIMDAIRIGQKIQDNGAKSIEDYTSSFEKYSEIREIKEKVRNLLKEFDFSPFAIN